MLVHPLDPTAAAPVERIPRGRHVAHHDGGIARELNRQRTMENAYMKRFYIVILQPEHGQWYMTYVY